MLVDLKIFINIAMTMSEKILKHKKYLVHPLLDNSPELFYGHFYANTTLEDLDNLLALKLACMSQIHSNFVQEAPAKSPCDGLMTTTKKLPLVVQHADCQAAIFWDFARKELAVVHAGWRGLVQEIYTETLTKFKSNGSNPENILVGIGPSLGKNNAEFRGWRDYFPAHFGAYEIKENYFDLKGIAEEELLRAGILKKNLSISPACTFEEKDKFHSWRRDKTDKRLVTVAMIL